MSDKRYYLIDYNEEYYIFDSQIITEEEVKEKIEYTYQVFADSLTGKEIVDKLNRQEKRIKGLKETNGFYDETTDNLINKIQRQTTSNEQNAELIKELLIENKILQEQIKTQTEAINKLQETLDSDTNQDELQTIIDKIQKHCKAFQVPITSSGIMPTEETCKKYNYCHEIHTFNAESFGKSKMANKILKIIKGE